MNVPARHGAHMINDRHCCFSLWAPEAQHVAVEFQDGSRQPLLAVGDGWFNAIQECQPGAAYRYRVDGYSVPDPASRQQQDGVHSYSLVVDFRDTRYRRPAWLGRPWEECIFYELHVGLLGGFAGVMDKLDYLQELGITALQLMPLAEFPGQRNWGYDGVLPFAPSRHYGTPAQFKALIDAAHERNLMVFVDVVYNHFGPDGNYLPRYAKRFFQVDSDTPWGQSINFSQPNVREFFYQNALMWLDDYQVDGLRLDAVHAIADRSFLLELAQRLRSALPPQRHIHLVVENQHNDVSLLENGYDGQWNDDGHNVLHHILTGETESYYRDFSDHSSAKLARVLSEGFVFQGGTDRMGRRRGQASGQLPATAFVLFLQNHDQVGNRAFGERLLQLCDHDAYLSAAALLLLSPMIPLLFMGEEWGCCQPFLFFSDHPPQLAMAVREGRKHEFREFSRFDGDDLPDPNALATYQASRPDFNTAAAPQHRQLTAYFRTLLTLRQTHIVPHLKGARSRGAQVLGEAAIWAEWQLADGYRLSLAFNLGVDDLALDRRLPQQDCLFNFRAKLDHNLLPSHSLIALLAKAA